MSGIRPHHAHGSSDPQDLSEQETFFQGDSEAVITTKARVNVCRDAIFIILKRVAFLGGKRKKSEREREQDHHHII